MPNESVGRTLTVMIILAVVCSLLVSVCAVGLRSLQEANKAREIKMNILAVADRYDPEKPVDELFAEGELRIVDLSTGKFVDADKVNPDTYDQQAAARDPALSDPIQPAKDIAGIGRREKYASVYLVKKEGGELDQVVLPVRGKGLWSTMFGFVAVGADLNTIRGMTFYQHGETPGLGAEIANPKWEALWTGKKLYNDQGQIKLRVIKGTVAAGSPDADFEIDGLSGATLTCDGVTYLIHYWFGPDGFLPFLQHLKEQGSADG